MDAKTNWIDRRKPAASRHREVWLLGQPPLGRYLNYREEVASPESRISPRILADEWRAANDYYYDLERDEAGLADTIKIRPLDPKTRALARKVKVDPRYKRAFDTLPTRIAMVEVEKLVVPQAHVNLDHAERLVDRLNKKKLAPAELFHFCLPLDREEARIQVRKIDSSRYLFWSQSSDFRFQEAALLLPSQLKNFESFGPIGSVLGLSVGYGSNFLNVIESDNRLLLHNGHHRAYALKARGIQFAPCIIQTVTRLDELNLVASRSVKEDPAFYFKASRPPMLKDFFDPRIAQIVDVPAQTRAVEVSFEVKEYEVPDFRIGY